MPRFIHPDFRFTATPSGRCRPNFDEKQFRKAIQQMLHSCIKYSDLLGCFSLRQAI